MADIDKLALVSQALSALGVDSDLPLNKAITVEELNSLLPAFVFSFKPNNVRLLNLVGGYSDWLEVVSPIQHYVGSNSWDTPFTSGTYKAQYNKYETPVFVHIYPISSVSFKVRTVNAKSIEISSSTYGTSHTVIAVVDNAQGSF